jgi:hypothetical protein
MTGKGSKHERGTIINFNEESDTASIWAASEVVYRRLKKLGYMPSRDNERSAVFEMLKRDIKLPRPKRGNERSTAREDQRVLKPGEIGGYFTRFA